MSTEKERSAVELPETVPVMPETPDHTVVDLVQRIRRMYPQTEQSTGVGWGEKTPQKG
jgi:hypothetical protein